MTFAITSRRWATTLDIAALAFLVRAALVVYALAEPVWDGHYYDLGARHIAWSHGYGEELHLSPYSAAASRL